jgi:uncharacterized membrane protein
MSLEGEPRADDDDVDGPNALLLEVGEAESARAADARHHALETGPEAAAAPARPWWTPFPKGDTRPVRDSLWARIITVQAAVVYIWFFTKWTFQNHDGFGTYGFDLGIYDQGLWLLSRFEAPFITIMGRNLFGDHTSFILLPLVPFYWIIPSPKVLLAAQSLALGGAAIPLFLLAREKLRDERPAALLAIALLAQPALGWANVEQFHPDVFEVPILLFMLWFLVRKRWLGYFVCLGLLLAVKEDVALLTVPIGIYVAMKHDRKMGLITIGASVSYFIIAVYVVLKSLNGIGTLNAWRLPGRSPRGFIELAVTDPGKLIVDFGGERVFYVWQLLAPWALVPLMSPSTAMICVAPLTFNFLSTFWYQFHIQYHYTTLIVPTFAFAVVMALMHLTRDRHRMMAAAGICAIALYTGWLWGPATIARNPTVFGDPNYPSIPSIHTAMDMIPDDATISVHYGYITHLEHRKRAYEFPVPFHAVNYGAPATAFDGKRLPEADLVEYVLLPATPVDGTAADVLARDVEPNFDLIYSSAYVKLFKRKP